MHFDYSKLRAEPERLGVIIDAADTDASIRALSVSDLFERVFDLGGFSVKPSNGGLIARQLVTRLGGLQGARVFKIPGCGDYSGHTGPHSRKSRHYNSSVKRTRIILTHGFPTTNVCLSKRGHSTPNSHRLLFLAFWLRKVSLGLGPT
jgi:hypothetical protein